MLRVDTVGTVSDEVRDGTDDDDGTDMTDVETSTGIADWLAQCLHLGFEVEDASKNNNRTCAATSFKKTVLRR